VLPLSYSLRSVVARRTRTLLTVAVIALVVLAVTLMLSLVSGIRRTLVNSGSPDNLIVMRDPAGNEFPNRGVYLEIVKNERLVFTDAYSKAWEPSPKAANLLSPPFINMPSQSPLPASASWIPPVTIL